MVIYDKVKLGKTENEKLLKELFNFFNSNFIKIVNKDDKLTEREILNIDVLINGYFVNGKLLSLNELKDTYLFAPNIFTNVSEEDYIKKYSLLIKNKKKLTESLLNKYKYSKNFDEIIGSIYLSDEDYFLLEDSKLKSFIFSKENDKYNYVLPNEFGYILRGANTYYYLLSNKGKFSHAEYENFKELYNNYQVYFKNVLYNLSELDNKVLILSVLDNIRNYLLILINMYSIMNQKCDETLLYEFENQIILALTNNTYELMISILENDSYELDKLKDLIFNTTKINFLNDIKNVKKTFYDKMLKSHRECDNFLENYIVVSEYLKTHKLEKNYVSTLYGGVEIPLIIRALNKNINIYYISLFGIYKDRHKTKLSYNDKIFRVNKNIKNDLTSAVLCDDNMMTGKTIQYIIDSLLINDIKINNILLINHVALNRIYQMIDNKTMMDIDLVDKYIFGLYYPTKYSKIKLNTNINNTYLDEFKIFDFSKEYICYYLYKNGLYKEVSRINKYRIEGIK